MSQAVQARCPACKKTLRIPGDWLQQNIRCKHCGALLKLRWGARPATAHEEKKTSGPSPGPEPGSGRPAAVSAEPSAPGPQEQGISSLAAAFMVDDGPILRVPERYRRRRRLGPIVGLVLLALVGVAAGTAFKNRDRIGRWFRAQGIAFEEERAAAPSSPADRKRPSAEDAPFPRRALAICINNYLYANPVAYGPAEHDVHELLDRLVHRLHFPESQVVELSDAARPARAPHPAGPHAEREDYGRPRAPREGRGRALTAGSKSKKSRSEENENTPLPPAPARPPLKPVIQKTITEFLDSSRPQDRIFLFLIGHVVEIENDVYLVPLEGELGVKESLIPFTWLYDRLKNCPARQKVLVVDTCRLDPGRGEERPGSGPMGKKLAALLATPPPGLQVWYACSAGEYSYEMDGAGVFLEKLIGALTGKTVGKTQHPDEPLPVSALAEMVDGQTNQEATRELQSKQTPHVAGAEPAEGAAYDAAAPLPARIDIPAPPAPEGGMARREEIRSILREIDLPPIRLARDETAALEIEALLPFAAKRMERYRADYTSLKEIERHGDKYPLRVAVLETVKLLNEKFNPHSAAFILRDAFGGGSSERLKKQILDEQRGPAELLAELHEALERLERVEKKRDDEESKRWQAHFDYIHAELLARIAYVHEYDLMLGKIRKDELPPLERGQNFYRLSSRVKLQGPRELKDYATRATKLFTKITRQHKGTPWEILAKRELLTALGLEWQPTR
jgi:hypothetical protein